MTDLEGEDPAPVSGDDAVTRALVALRARMPQLPDLPQRPPEQLASELRAVARDAGRELKRLRAFPRSRTAPLARLREGCRTAISALHTLERARRKLDAARRRTET